MRCVDLGTFPLPYKAETLVVRASPHKSLLQTDIRISCSFSNSKHQHKPRSLNMSSKTDVNIWSLMNYVPPRGSCNFRQGFVAGNCPCLRFMVHPLKVRILQTSKDNLDIVYLKQGFLIRQQRRLNATAVLTMLPSTAWTTKRKRSSSIAGGRTRRSSSCSWRTARTW